MVTRRNNRKWLWWGVGFLMIVIISVAIVLAINKTKPISGNTQNQTVATPVEKEEKSEVKEKQEEVSGTEKKEEVKQYEGEDPNESESLTGVISYTGVSGDNLMVRVNIDQYLSGGNCKLVLAKNGMAVYSGIAEIESLVSTSTCNGFDVPVTGIGAGNFVVEVTLESDGKYGKMVGEVTI